MVAVVGGEDLKCTKYVTFLNKTAFKNIIKALKNRTACLIANHDKVAGKFRKDFCACSRDRKYFNQYINAIHRNTTDSFKRNEK